MNINTLERKTLDLLRYIRTNKMIEVNLMLFLLFGLLLDTITTLFGMEVGHIETNQFWFIHKLIVFFIFSFLRYAITSKNKFIKWFYIMFCVSFGIAWFMAGIHNIYMIILWWGR